MLYILDEKSKGESTRGELVMGQNDLLPNLQWYIELPATSWFYSGILKQQLPAEFSVVHWSTSYWLNLQRNIELPAFSWMRTATLRLPATSWMHRGTLKYQLSVEFTVIHWAASFQLNLQWYNELQGTSLIYSSKLSYLLPDEFTVERELPASSSIYYSTLNNQQAAEFTNVHWFTSYQLNLRKLPAFSWMYGDTLNY